eukprot:TRINITY_DN3333_c0_g1_i1.p3 TRINITY_DN3333_c0_g1~~TRINITY_DN3333_c0_g1_i1.p3  ORF type:complete len:101 (-),score=45.75 TRINITY_DN3333_c0_g1_i1:488-790(-)
MANREEQERSLGKLEAEGGAEADIDEGKASEAASAALAPSQAAESDEEKQRLARLAAVKVNKEDIEFLHEHFEMEKADAKRKLQEADGDVTTAARALLAQ